MKDNILKKIIYADNWHDAVKIAENENNDISMYIDIDKIIKNIKISKMLYNNMNYRTKMIVDLKTYDFIKNIYEIIDEINNISKIKKYKIYINTEDIDICKYVNKNNCEIILIEKNNVDQINDNNNTLIYIL